MQVNIEDTAEVGLTILQLVNNLKTKYGKISLSKILTGNESKYIKRLAIEAGEAYGCLQAFSQEQTANLIQQLLDTHYLQNMSIGTGYEVIIFDLTEKGLEALNQKQPLQLNLPKIYPTDFKQASDIPLIDKEILDEYYQLKLELSKLTKREEELKETIKKTMTDYNCPYIHTQNMDLFCKRVERVLYPKDKVEAFVPQDLLEKIKTLKETIVLSAKLRVKKDEDNRQADSTT